MPKQHNDDLSSYNQQILEKIRASYSCFPIVEETYNRIFSAIQNQTKEVTFDAMPILYAIEYALHKHLGQYRKNKARNPYIIHPLGVMQILWDEAEVRNPTILISGILHDVLEDTDTTREELEGIVGARVALIVEELTNDPSLSSVENKLRQIEKAPSITEEARVVKLADRIQNLRELKTDPPEKWEKEKIDRYVDWSKELLKTMKGTHQELESLLERATRDLSRNA